jgi:acyl-CoA reductase-like NAD-dependent aldehyde dehydrogenase
VELPTRNTDLEDRGRNRLRQRGGTEARLELAWPGCFAGLALRSAGLPDGVVNVITGPGRSTGDALVQHPDVQAVSYTGSNEVGRSVREACGRLGKRSQVELGGQNPALVLAAADLGQAAAAAAVGAFGNAGQKCTSTRRLIVHSSIAESLVALIESEAARFVLGDPQSPETTLGPLVTASAVDEYESALANARAEGATVVVGGVVEPRHGFYVRPAIVTSLAAGSFLAREEVFAPILGVLTFDDEDEAVELANGVRFGLSAAVFTRDIGAARRVSRRLRAGIVRVNAQTAGADVHVPFGGMKQSGSGYREQGRAAREFYTELKTVYEDPAPRIED